MSNLDLVPVSLISSRHVLSALSYTTAKSNYAQTKCHAQFLELSATFPTTQRESLDWPGDQMGDWMGLWIWMGTSTFPTFPQALALRKFPEKNSSLLKKCLLLGIQVTWISDITSSK